MKTTYTLEEVKWLVRSLTLEEIDVLQFVLDDEASLYSPAEFKTLKKMIGLRINFLQSAKVPFGSRS